MNPEGFRYTGIFLPEISLAYLTYPIPRHLIEDKLSGAPVAGDFPLAELDYLVFGQGYPWLGLYYGYGYFSQPVIGEAD